VAEGRIPRSAALMTDRPGETLHRNRSGRTGRRPSRSRDRANPIGRTQIGPALTPRRRAGRVLRLPRVPGVLRRQCARPLRGWPPGASRSRSPLLYPTPRSPSEWTPVTEGSLPTARLTKGVLARVRASVSGVIRLAAVVGAGTKWW